MIDTSILKVGDKVRIDPPNPAWDGHVFPIGWFTVTDVIMSPSELASVPMNFRISEDPRLMQMGIIKEIEAA